MRQRCRMLQNTGLTHRNILRHGILIKRNSNTTVPTHRKTLKSGLLLPHLSRLFTRHVQTCWGRLLTRQRTMWILQSTVLAWVALICYLTRASQEIMKLKILSQTHRSVKIQSYTANHSITGVESPPFRRMRKRHPVGLPLSAACLSL